VISGMAPEGLFDRALAVGCPAFEPLEVGGRDREADFLRCDKWVAWCDADSRERG
jgi:hypothetical protein